MSPLELPGCRPLPLGHYLKALGVLRTLSQHEPRLRGFWRGPRFFLDTELAAEDLLTFYLDRYVPTPIVVPWSGSDFFDASPDPAPERFVGLRKPPTAGRVIEAVLVTDDPRLAGYRDAIRATLAAFETLGLHDKQQIGKPEAKRRLLTALRATLPDDTLGWLDVTSAPGAGPDDLSFNTLLGSGGGNDGNTHFSDNFMQCLWQVLPAFAAQRAQSRGGKRAAAALDPEEAIRVALFDRPSRRHAEKGRSPGLFDADAVGGPNAGTGFEAAARADPWDYILALEGSVLLSGAVSRRMGAHAADAAFPFTVSLSAAGYASAVSAEGSAREVWLPLWSAPATVAELVHLFGEGRAQVHARGARNGVDFARAVAGLGVDRGITGFERIGLVRGRVGGDNYHTAVPLGHWPVADRERRPARLLDTLDEWLDRLRRAARGKETPNTVQTAQRQLDDAVLDLCRRGRPQDVQGVLIALGRTQRRLARSLGWARKAYLPPVPCPRGEWLAHADDGSPELRLAAGLASMDDPALGPLRRNLEPAVGPAAGGHWHWSKSDRPPEVVWRTPDLPRNMAAVLLRRAQDAQRHASDPRRPSVGLGIAGHRPVPLTVLAAFLAGELDEARIGDLLGGLALLSPGEMRMRLTAPPSPGQPRPLPMLFYPLLKLCALPDQGRRLLDAPRGPAPIPFDPRIPRRLLAGDLAGALTIAAARLRGSGIAPRIRSVPDALADPARLAAALLLPIAQRAEHYLYQRVLDRPVDEEQLKSFTEEMSHEA